MSWEGAERAVVFPQSRGHDTVSSLSMLHTWRQLQKCKPSPVAGGPDSRPLKGRPTCPATPVLAAYKQTALPPTTGALFPLCLPVTQALVELQEPTESWGRRLKNPRLWPLSCVKHLLGSTPASCCFQASGFAAQSLRSSPVGAHSPKYPVPGAPLWPVPSHVRKHPLKQLGRCCPAPGCIWDLASSLCGVMSSLPICHQPDVPHPPGAHPSFARGCSVSRE